MRIIYTTIALCLVGVAFLRCSTQPRTSTPFTKADSVTDFYLRLQDTLHVQWNLMMSDDNKKIQAMNHLVHELMVTGPGDSGLFKGYNDRLGQLTRMRYTQKSMFNADVIREYDYATRALIMELVSVAEAKSEYSYNVTLQKLVDDILISDQRTTDHRQLYDSLATIYNRFLERNQKFLVESNLTTEKKPLFDQQ